MEKLIQTKLFINNQYVDSISGSVFPTYNPTNEKLITNVSEARQEDVDLAVLAARKAFDEGPWRRFTGYQRSLLLLKLADLISQNIEEISYIEVIDNGKPISNAKDDVIGSVQLLRYYAGFADKLHGQTIPFDGPYFVYTRKEPVGVCAAILPWNFPFSTFIWKVAAPLAAGCTLVVKPAELTPLSALYCGQLFAQAGFPEGVINIINGFGLSCGRPLCQSELVDKISFTGSTEIGYEIIRNSHISNLKRITLELGGKSANIILEDADLDLAVSQSLKSAFCTQGQCCIAPGRIFVQANIYDEFCKKAVELASKRKVGDPLKEETEHGPQIDNVQCVRILELIKSGFDEGAKLLYGGSRIEREGFFIEPTVFGEVEDHMRIAKEEIFGPVMVILKFHSIDEVIKRANKSKYGLGAGVFSKNMENTIKITNALKAGTVYQNCYDVCGVNTPFGGFKDSGIGRELGEVGIQIYTELKTVICKTSEDTLP
jgi:aldehyde dehydrogenase (NAD+)